MKLTPLFGALSCATSALSISVMLPLYVYPESGAWDPVYKAISTNSGVKFYVIVNPDSGPGGDAYPPSDYAAAITKLNSYKNVVSLGYVRTNYTHVPYDEVTTNITKYANWAKKSQTTAISGIFFDEGTDSTASAPQTYMKNGAAFARNAIPGATVVFNPGAPEPDAYFNYADFIVDFEGAWDDYSASQTPLKFAQGERAKSAIIVHDTPADADLVGAAETAQADGIGAIYFTGDCCYNEVGMVGKAASAVQAAGK